MAKKQFKAESRRLLDLMINSIYTHKEIFLREILSNASDAEDKLAYRALTDDSVGMNRSDFKIILTPDKVDTAKKDLKILDPLPRVNEISVKIDEDPRACYFKQVRNGKFIRMALILKLLKEAEA